MKCSTKSKPKKKVALGKTDKVSVFDPVYTQFKGKGKLAIKHLMKVKKGEALEALYREEVGYIDIIWGENDPKTNIGFGLKHIIEKHGAEIKQMGFDVEYFIPIIIQCGDFNKEKSTRDKFVFESKMFRFVVSTDFKGTKKNWLLTAFDLKKKSNPKK